MNRPDEDRIKKLLREALPPVEADREPTRDLWLDVLRRLDAQSAHPMDHLDQRGWLWFDCALAAGLFVVAAVFPASIPVILYYL